MLEQHLQIEVVEQARALLLVTLWLPGHRVRGHYFRAISLRALRLRPRLRRRRYYTQSRNSMHTVKFQTSNLFVSPSILKKQLKVTHSLHNVTIIPRGGLISTGNKAINFNLRPVYFISSSIEWKISFFSVLLIYRDVWTWSMIENDQYRLHSKSDSTIPRAISLYCIKYKN